MKDYRYSDEDYPSEEYSVAEFVLMDYKNDENQNTSKDEYTDYAADNLSEEDWKKIEEIGREKMKRFSKRIAAKKAPIQEQITISTDSEKVTDPSESTDNQVKLNF